VPGAATIAAWTGLLLVALALAVVVHELGHAAAGWALRAQVRSIEIGRWGPKRVFHFGALAVIVHIVPIDGRTAVVARSRGEELITIAAGPAANAGFGALCVWAASGEAGSAAAVFGALGAVNLFAALCNLVPLPPRPPRRGSNDGWRLGGLLVGTRGGRSLQELRWALALLGDEDDVRRARGVTQAEALLARVDEPPFNAPQVRSGLANAVEFALVRAPVDDPATVGRAEGFASLARDARPDHAPHVVTLALVRIRQGRHEEAESLVVAALDAATTAHQRAICETVLALALCGSGRRQEASELLAKVRAVQPGNPMLREAEASLATDG
jgi:hypothetical protein